jgi:4-hydroxybenzoyl-CoA thioesterase
MFTNRREVTIEWGDCDPAGIVFYPRYFAMFDASTAALFAAALGFNKFEMLARYNIIGIPMVDTGAKFLHPSRFGDVIAIASRVTMFHRSSFDISHLVYRPAGTPASGSAGTPAPVLAIEAHETRVWAGRDRDDPQRIKGLPVPGEIVARLSQANGADS